MGLRGKWVGNEQMRCAAKGVARELVGEDEERERPFRGFDPVVVPACRDGQMQIEKALPKRGVEGSVLLEPLAGGRPPEGHDVFGRFVPIRIRSP